LETKTYLERAASVKEVFRRNKGLPRNKASKEEMFLKGTAQLELEVFVERVF
jgi:hypothetical protein